MSERPNEQASTADFEFSALQKAENYRAALLREFSPALTGRVLEIGAGIGQITEGLRCLKSVTEVVAVEPEEKFCAEFERRLPDMRLVRGTISDLGDDKQWDAIVCINVLEHIRHDTAELSKMCDRLRARKGSLCLFVPARQEIYAPLDKDFGHFRRYSKPELRDKLQQAGFKITRLRYFNWIGYFGWWWTFRVQKKRTFDVKTVTLFDRWIFPPMHWVETHVAPPMLGQSLLAIAQA